jgi:hypothetical protein
MALPQTFSKPELLVRFMPQYPADQVYYQDAADEDQQSGWTKQKVRNWHT